jgi:ABC-type lipoprotein release transport system permease subunit
MVAFKLAFRNLIGAGLRTWLNVIVLSFAFFIIIFLNGFIDGWNRQARKDTMNWETGNGQLWHPEFDRYDPYTYQDAHTPVTDEVMNLVKSNVLTPVLITQATIYPQGRMESIILKGIDPDQKILLLTTNLLVSEGDDIPALIGKRMAASSRLKKDDLMLVRWRDKNGTFDAVELRIAGVFDCNVPTVDNGQIWIALDKLQKMTGMDGEATFFIAGKSYTGGDIAEWKYKDLKFLLSDMDKIIQSKKIGQAIIYLLLLCIALLAIFDTQVLSIFRRQKEIGTYVALGMTRYQVVGIFTVEGAAHSILAIILGAIYGIPFLLLLNKTGIPMPIAGDQMGISIAEKIFPAYSLGLITFSILLVVITATIVSYLPARKIAKMNPTDALKGKLQ